VLNHLKIVHLSYVGHNHNSVACSRASNFFHLYCAEHSI